jgi:hypothetical protein
MDETLGIWSQISAENEISPDHAAPRILALVRGLFNHDQETA